jgi:hypothetical protein
MNSGHYPFRAGADNFYYEFYSEEGRVHEIL